MKCPDPSDVAAVLLSGWLIGAGGLALAQQGGAPAPQPTPERPGTVNPGNRPQCPAGDTEPSEPR